jgi:protoporphyrinogen oxidase
MPKKAIIIGAGPAGLTAAYELLQRTDIKPIILEKSGQIGGISKTVNYKGNRMDIGGHRFFSKSDRVMNWWLNMMPIASTEGAIEISYQNNSRHLKTDPASRPASAPADPDKVMLIRNRLSRIYFLRKFFTYPIQLSLDTLRKLGLVRTLGILLSYGKARLFPRKLEKNLEDFFINRFGEKLYRLFFKDYTEKVWGIACTSISAEWGAQRIKGISIGKALAHAVRSLKPKSSAANADIGQKATETSLIERFLYPKYGPGQLWEEVARQIIEKGGEIRLNQEVRAIHTNGQAITAIESLDSGAGKVEQYTGDYFFSTMPVKELIAGMNGAVPAHVVAVAEGLQYRDFITVGVLLSKMTTEKMLPDTWIYIQEKDVKVGRLQIFNNWSPFMVKDPDTIWLGMEYFCNVTDDFWLLSDQDIQAVAIAELQQMGLAAGEDVLDSTVLRVEKTYPAYFGTYDRFDEIRQYTDQFANLFLIGRNGMHKYNNSDHSMLTAMVAVDNIAAGVTAKANLWAINTEQEYHEEKAAGAVPVPPRAPAAGFRLRGPSWDYLWNNRTNRAWWITAFAVFVIQFILFKIRYPFANYMPDSYYYLEAAATNADVNIWPVAYSKFLRLISVFTHSDKIVVGIQYFFMQVSALTFLFTLFYFLKPGLVVRNILLVFFLLDPAILYISNYISADSLFIGLSFLWLTSLLWIIYQPKPWQVFAQAVLLLACFTVRYNAIYYPLIAATAFLISRYRWFWKLSGIGLGTAFVMLSVLFTSTKMKDLTGQRQFSAFGGWQLANNALYMYETIPAKERGLVPERFARLESMVRQHMDTLNRVKLTAEDTVSAHFYLWSPKGPLVQYMVREWKKDTVTSAFKRWATEGPLYSDYALYLIRKYPIPFVKSFLLQNAVKYAVPPVEFLQVYNMGQDSVAPIAKEWFNYKTQKVSNKNKIANRIGIMEGDGVVATIINVFFLICLVGIALFNGYRQSGSPLPKILLLVLTLWLLNTCFSIFASPVVIRYQIFPVLVAFCLSLITSEAIYQFGIQEEKNKKKSLA